MNPANWMRRHVGAVCALACAAALIVAAGAGILRGHAQSSSSLPTFDLPKPASTKAPVQAPAQPNQQQAAAAGGKAESDDARKPEIAQECANLLKMATDLKAEVDKSTKDELSLTVVRKANEIEQLAHQVRTGTARAESKPPKGP